MKWLTHFGLKETPFSKEIGDADLWVPSSRKHVVGEIVRRALGNDGSAVQDRHPIAEMERFIARIGQEARA